jgi:hypothetical protein
LVPPGAFDALAHRIVEDAPPVERP